MGQREPADVSRAVPRDGVQLHGTGREDRRLRRSPRANAEDWLRRHPRRLKRNESNLPQRWSTIFFTSEPYYFYYYIYYLTNKHEFEFVNRL